MIWIVILLTIISLSTTKENYPGNQETVLKNVSFQSMNKTSVGLPLFMLKANLQKPYAMCYPNSSSEQTIKLSLAICKHLGYDALQSFFPADVSLIKTIPPGKGLYFRPDCSSYILEQQFCNWKLIAKEICDKYLGIECADCSYMVEITGRNKKEIHFPTYVSCFTNSKCQWIIINRHPKDKITVLEFKKEYFEVSASPDGVYYDNDEDHADHIEVKWFNKNNKKWITLQTTVRTLNEVDPIKIRTDNITISYFSKDCQLNVTKGIRKNLATLQYYGEESQFVKQDNSHLIMYIIVFVFMLGFIFSVILTVCCYLKSRSARRAASYSMSYIPGLDISYDEFDGTCAAEEPVATSGAGAEDQYINLGLNNPQIQNAQLPEQEGIGNTDQLQKIMSQLASKYAPKGSQNCDDEELFSCKSDDSLRTFYSVHPSRRPSRNDSFISIRSDSHLQSTNELLKI